MSLITAAKAARIERDTRRDAEATDAAAIAQAQRDAIYAASVDAAHQAAVAAFGKIHADCFTWYRLSPSDTIPYARHEELEPRLRLAWQADITRGTNDPTIGSLRLYAVPGDGRVRPVTTGSPGIASLADLGDALAAWEADQEGVGRR